MLLRKFHPIFRFLTYLGDLCVSKGTAIQKVQGMVCEGMVCDVVLKKDHSEILMKLRSVLYLLIYITVCSYSIKMCLLRY